MLARGQAARAVAAAALLAGVGCAGAPRPPSKPDVLVVVVDTLRADHLGSYGYARPTDPALAAFEAEATRFTECYAPSPWTGPSVASLVTGLHPSRHRAIAHGARLPEEASTLAEILRGHGWATAAWSFNVEVSPATGHDQGFDAFHGVEGDALDYPDIARMVEAAGTWLSSDGTRPAFAYLQPMNVHGPYRVPASHRDVLLGRPPASGFSYYDDLMKAVMWGGRTDLRRRVGREYVDSLIEQYDTAVRYTTDRLAELLDGLRASGRYDDTLIVLTSDHGEELFEHGGFSHGYTLHREVLHVPLYVKLPGQREARTVRRRVCLTDVLPTLLDVLGIETAQPVDGRSLAAWLRGEASRPAGGGEPEPLLFQTDWAGRCLARAMLDGRYKLIAIRSAYDGTENTLKLFDVDADPDETHSLAGDRRALTEQMWEDMRRRFEDLEARAVLDPGNALDDMDVERLKSLGYVDD